MYSAPAPAHTPAKPDYRRQPMRWKPLRTIAEVTPVLYSAPVAAPSLAEYSKGSSTLCDVYPCGTVAHAERVTAAMPGAVSLRPALTPGLRRESATFFRLTIGTEVLIRSASMRCGVPVFTIERICPFELEASKAFAAVLT